MNQQPDAELAAPGPEGTVATFRLPYAVTPGFAAGAWFKNSVCIVKENQAWVSRTVGDLDTPQACRDFDQISAVFLDWLALPPQWIACDLHPDFHSSQRAAQWAQAHSARLVPVQHHHAHSVAVALEHGWNAPVLGLALDGVGMGDDGTPWGGELLAIDARGSRRLGHFVPLPMPGGDQAARAPWRMAAAVLHGLGRHAEIVQRFPAQGAAAALGQWMMQNAQHPIYPLTSSAGRLFDAVAGLLGYSEVMDFEAQAAIALEQGARRSIDQRGWPEALPWTLEADGRLNFLPALAWLADVPRADADWAAARFHATLGDALAAWVLAAAAQTQIRHVVCGGGCFLNRLLCMRLQQALDGQGITLMEAQRLSPGDAGLALGQAWVAACS